MALAVGCFWSMDGWMDIDGYEKDAPLYYKFVACHHPQLANRNNRKQPRDNTYL